jgi:hypothetical protein
MAISAHTHPVRGCSYGAMEAVVENLDVIERSIVAVHRITNDPDLTSIRAATHRCKPSNFGVLHDHGLGWEGGGLILQKHTIYRAAPIDNLETIHHETIDAISRYCRACPCAIG